jgi:hypothetical protein
MILIDATAAVLLVAVLVIIAIWPWRRSAAPSTPQIIEPVPEEVAENIFRAVFAPPVYRAPRNSPCPCGSGMKFKHCHG